MTLNIRSNAIILPTHTANLFQSAVRRATALLRAGGAVAVPTETVYGLAANALDAKAVARLFEMKGRPAQNPIIVHVASVAMARRCVSQWPRAAAKLAAAFWPGPLTLVLPRSGEIPDIVTAGGSTVGVRWPQHPFIQALIRECGFPLAAPSANPSGQVSPTSAEHVHKHFGSKIRLIVDGGQSQVGIESTVLDLSVEPLRLLRPGMIGAESLAAVVSQGGWRTAPQELSVGKSASDGKLRSPGLLPKHYSPKAKLVVTSWKDEADLQWQISNLKFERSTVHVIAHTCIPNCLAWGRVRVIPHDAEAFARAIYAEWHRCDEEGAQLIVVEAVPETAQWQAIADRLQRAAG
jgi:L-threonylcarbamoyladenylate synthase